MYYTRIDSPVGRLLLTADDKALTGVCFADKHGCSQIGKAWAGHPVLCEAKRQLGEYFAGQRRKFELPLAPAGTKFQRRVWKALEHIPYGETCAYGEIARRIGKPKAVRAVGAANGANPIPIIVPCHRVIGADGSLTGYGGGLTRKKKLLALESVTRRG